MTTATEAPPRRGSLRAMEIVAAGALGGMIGGTAMMFFLMFDLGGLGLGFVSPYAAIAATFLGPVALVGGPGALVLGGVIHVVVCVALGILFAALVPPRTGGGPALAYGLTAGIVTLLVMSFLILPWADPTLDSRVRFFEVSWAFAHVLFGIGLAFIPALRRVLTAPSPA